MPLEATLREKACVVCKTIFKPRSARQKYCSEPCKRGISTCKQCEKTFIRKRNTTGEFCSLACWYAWPGRVEDRMCPICERPFRPRSKQKTCSYECANQSLRTTNRRINCENCGTLLRRNVHPRIRFCSKSCALRARDNQGHLHAPLGAIHSGPTGYRVMKVGKGYPGANTTGWILHHRWVMAQQLGRYLEPYERVHHKNGIRDDNDPSNLELWVIRKKDPAGQRVEDLIEFVVTRYRDQVIDALGTYDVGWRLYPPCTTS
jgi:hypothetical protein